MSRLTISDRRERALVAAADAMLRPAAWMRRSRRTPDNPSRILCCRLERIGDLLMTVPALADLRSSFPSASIDLVVGSWNRDLAQAIDGIARVETLDAAWLSRGAGGLSPLQLAARATAWRTRRYDLAINFEPDIRSNLAIARTGALFRAGFASGGGAPLLDLALDMDVTAHTVYNARVLVEAIAGARYAPVSSARLRLPEVNRADAAARLAPLAAGRARLVGIHVSGGRAIKQWPPERFRDVAQHLVRERSAALVLTGTPDDRAMIDLVRGALPQDRVFDASDGVDLLTVAAMLERLDLFVTGDTGPMHLAHAVGTPIVAVFGPSDPRRYAPLGFHDRVVRVDLPCSPCNRIRHPPARCVGHTPDCLAGVETAQVLAAIDETFEALDTRRREAAR
jgi:ADP-heptose:LPS heptosyltransferase